MVELLRMKDYRAPVLRHRQRAFKREAHNAFAQTNHPRDTHFPPAKCHPAVAQYPPLIYEPCNFRPSDAHLASEDPHIKDAHRSTRPPESDVPVLPIKLERAHDDTVHR